MAEGQADPDLPHARTLEPRHFEIRDDWTIQKTEVASPASYRTPVSANGSTESAVAAVQTVPKIIFSQQSPFLCLYHGDCFQVLDSVAAKHPEGRFDAIFADPPYFLSNGGITCHAGRMVKVDKGDWDKSRGPELNHEFNREWLRRCQKVLKPNGTIWVSGTHHVIFSIGYAMQQLGFKILNDIAWEKPNPPPNLSCRYFTHSTETVLWAAKNEKSKHVFNYSEMKAVTGKQMKTVWQFYPPNREEKEHGKHPTQKPIALVERCLLASTNPGDLVLDPFLGGGTTAIAALKLKRGCVGIEADFTHITLAAKRADHEIISIWLRHFRVAITVTVFTDGKPIENPVRIPSLSPALASAGKWHCHRPTPGTRAQNTQNPEMVSSNLPQIDLDLFRNSINGSRVDEMPQPQMPTERIFHETKFVFLSCAEVERGAVVHTTVDVSLQEAWAKTPTGKKRETTHIVRCETEILRIRER